MNSKSDVLGLNTSQFIKRQMTKPSSLKMSSLIFDFLLEAIQVVDDRRRWNYSTSQAWFTCGVALTNTTGKMVHKNFTRQPKENTIQTCD